MLPPRHPRVLARVTRWQLKLGIYDIVVIVILLNSVWKFSSLIYGARILIYSAMTIMINRRLVTARCLTTTCID